MGRRNVSKVIDESPEDIEDDGPVDTGGLTLKQRQFILGLASGKTPQIVCNELDMNIRTYFRWQHLPEFSRAVDELFSKEDLVHLKNAIHNSAADTINVLEEAMANANRDVKVNVSCPFCKKAFDTIVRVEDWKSRLTAVGMILKITGILLDRRESKMDINVTYKLTMGENLMRLRWMRGEAISLQAEERLRELGAISGERPLLADPEAPKQDYIEGEYTEGNQPNQ